MSSSRELFSDPNLAPVSSLLNFEIFNPATGILSDPDLQMPPAKDILNNRELVCAPVTRMHNDPCLHNAKEKTNMPSLPSHKTVLDVSSCPSLAREKVISHSLTSGTEQLVVSACMSSHQTREIVTDNAIDPPISTVIVEKVSKSERVNAKSSSSTNETRETVTEFAYGSDPVIDAVKGLVAKSDRELDSGKRASQTRATLKEIGNASDPPKDVVKRELVPKSVRELVSSKSSSPTREIKETVKETAKLYDIDPPTGVVNRELVPKSDRELHNDKSSSPTSETLNEIGNASDPPMDVVKGELVPKSDREVLVSAKSSSPAREIKVKETMNDIDSPIDDVKGELMPKSDAELVSVKSSSQIEETFRIINPPKSAVNEGQMVPKIDINAITIGEEIGRGAFAFGIVRKANWNGTNVAVKEIAIKRMKVMKTLIDRELCLHSKLRHPNIVLLMAHAMEGNRLHLITELIDRDSLDDVLFSGNYLSMELPVKLSVCKKICQAVAYLHSNIPAIIHRDIKPENLLIGDTCNTVKLCDMGLSKLKTMNTIMTTMAGGSLQPGTPPYQAPEVLVDRKSGNTSTDIWSMSCTLVEVF